MSTGPTGITGAYGLQGRRGAIGPPLGPTGPAYPTGSSSNLVLTVVTPSSSNISLSASEFGTYYNITPTATTGALTVTFPSITENFPVSEQQGRPWVFHNNCGTSVTITFVGGTVTYLGDNYSTQFYLAIGQGISITYGGALSGTSYIVY
jgi:hypothetical protein